MISIFKLFDTPVYTCPTYTGKHGNDNLNIIMSILLYQVSGASVVVSVSLFEYVVRARR